MVIRVNFFQLLKAFVRNTLRIALKGIDTEESKHSFTYYYISRADLKRNMRAIYIDIKTLT